MTEFTDTVGPSGTVMVCEQVAVFPQGSAACHVRVTVYPFAITFVVVLTTVIVTLVPLQPSLALGSVKLNGASHATVASGAHVIIGAVRSTMATTCVHIVLFAD